MGYTLLELLVAISLVAIVGSAAIPVVSGSVDQTRAAGAASYVASRMAMARFEAVRRSRTVAIRFTQNEEGYWLRTYADGNANGVLSIDIVRGVDWPLTPDERLDSHFPGVTFGILPKVTNIDDGAVLDAADPIQIGSSPLLSFSPMGSSTSGTLFIRGRGANQFAVRILGSTGRARIFRFSFGDGAWRVR